MSHTLNLSSRHPSLLCSSRRFSINHLKNRICQASVEQGPQPRRCCLFVWSPPNEMCDKAAEGVLPGVKPVFCTLKPEQIKDNRTLFVLQRGKLLLFIHLFCASRLAGKCRAYSQTLSLQRPTFPRPPESTGVSAALDNSNISWFSSSRN